MKRINDIAFAEFQFGKNIIRQYGKIEDIWIDYEGKPRFKLSYFNGGCDNLYSVEPCEMEDAINHMKKQIESLAGKLHYFKTLKSFGMVTNVRLDRYGHISFDFQELNACGDNQWSCHPDDLVPATLDDMVEAMKTFIWKRQ